MLDKFFDLIRNIKGGPLTTLAGLVMFILGAVIFWDSYKSEEPMAFYSVEVAVFAAGAYLLSMSDRWIKSLFRRRR